MSRRRKNGIATWTRNEFEISTDPRRMDMDWVHRELSRTYWGKNVTRSIRDKAFRNSLSFGLYHQEKQIGCARLITDRATFAYLCDVVIAKRQRGKGLGRWLNECILSHPELRDLRTWLLATRDAHGLYGKCGWTSVTHPERLMHYRGRAAHPNKNKS